MKNSRKKIALVVTAALAAAVGTAPVALADEHDHSPSTLTVENKINNSNRSNVGAVTGTGVNCGADCAETFPFQETCRFVGEGGNHGQGRTQCDQVSPNVTLNAAPAAGYSFAGWSGGGCSGTGACKPIVLGPDTSVVANYADATNPAVAITSPSADSFVGGTVNLGATASDNEAVARVEFSMLRSGNRVRISDDTSAPYSTTLDTRPLPNGTTRIYAKAIDTSGRESEAERILIVDNAAPSGSITAPADGQLLAGTHTFTASAADALSGVREVQFFLDNATAPHTVDGSFPYTMELNTKQLNGGDGNHSVYAVIVDKAGTTFKSAARSYVVDNTAPVLSVSGIVNGQVTSNNRPTVTFSATDARAVTYSCVVGSGAFTRCDSPYTLPELADGTHELRVAATDAAGNTSIEQISFGVDTTGPAVRIVSGPPAKSKIKKGKFAASFAFETEAPETTIAYSCRMDEGEWSECTSPTTYKVKPGKHLFQVKGTDSIGNESVITTTHAFNVVKKKRKK